MGLIRDEVKRWGSAPISAPGRASRGGSEMEGLLEVAETVFDGPVRRGVPACRDRGLVDVVSRPEWAVATGLLLYGQRTQSHRKPKGFSMTRVKKFFGDFF
jgi:cell division protein FtsA